MARHGEAVVDAREFQHALDDELAGREFQVGGFGVDGPVQEIIGDGFGGGSAAVFVRPPEEHVDFGECHGEVDLAGGIFEGVGDVPDEAGGCFEPLGLALDGEMGGRGWVGGDLTYFDVRAFGAVAGEDANVRGEGSIPLPVLAALLQAFGIADLVGHRHDDLWMGQQVW